MYKIHVMLLLLFTFLAPYCQAQDEEVTIDSTAILSRKKADIVLNQFGLSYDDKILYSLKNKHYYIILQKNNKYKEYYVELGSDNTIKKMRLLVTQNKHLKVIAKAFVREIYHSGFKTSASDATYVRGVPSYFVLKGKDGKRYGEYRLYSLTLPTPIEGVIYVYLIKRLSEEIASEK